MANIASANIGSWTRVGSGNKLMCYSKIKGDGSGTSVPVPLGRPEAAWSQNIDDTSMPNISALPTTAPLNVVTYSAAPTSGKYHWLFVIGTD